MKEEIVSNDVYIFKICFDYSLTIPIYVDKGAFNEDEFEVEEAYFTQEKIDELKNQFISEIKNNSNPFSIFCIDRDGNYNVTINDIFRKL